MNSEGQEQSEKQNKNMQEFHRHEQPWITVLKGHLALIISVGWWIASARERWCYLPGFRLRTNIRRQIAVTMCETSRKEKNPRTQNPVHVSGGRFEHAGRWHKAEKSRAAGESLSLRAAALPGCNAEGSPVSRLHLLSGGAVSALESGIQTASEQDITDLQHFLADRHLYHT